MIARAVRRTLGMACRMPGGIPVARRLRSRSVAIVMYHGITATPMEVPNWCQLDAGEFEQQIEYLASEYRVLPLREVVDRLRQRKALPARTVCLTFDDGFRNVGTTAFPILGRLQVPATVFLVTGVVGTRQPAWPDLLFHDIARTRLESIACEGEPLPLATPEERSRAAATLARGLKAMENDRRERVLEGLRERIGRTEVPPDSPQATLDWDEIRRLADTGLIEFGSHTHTHPILSRCSPERQREELQSSRDTLVERLGRADLFAYPNGTPADFTGDTQAILRDLGYRCAVSTIPGLNRAGTDVFALRRVPVGFDTVGERFRIGMLGL
jgi:peptidoglycan/xylan/chitin deacetylase (PgdA/CDA1 family)